MITPAETTASVLRRQFDASFAEPPAPTPEELESLLAIRLAGEPHAIRLSHLVEVLIRPTVTAIPTGTPGLLGLVGVRGRVLPAFELGSILGYDPAPNPGRWIVLCNPSDPIGLVFADFEGHLRLPKSALRTAEITGKYLTEFARTDAESRAIVDIPLVVANLRAGTKGGRKTEKGASQK